MSASSNPRLQITRLGRSALLRGTALQSVFVLSLLLPTGSANAQLSPNARPQGGAVSTGSAAIAASGSTTSINQSSQNAAINWSSFNVGSNQSVQITAPNSSAVTVNRVTAGNPSQIAGQIKDNGVFVLANPSGVVFDKGAQVTASSVIVTTAGVTDQNVKAGRLAFDQPGNAAATVVNHGHITVRQAGLAALVAPGVANSGVISAPMGKVVLAGAAASTVDLYGDGLMSIDVSKQVTQLPNGPDGKPVTALVTNTGTITAAGGKILLTARAVDGIVTNLVDAGGRISADTTAQGKTGRVVINGIGGSLTIQGDISAAGKAPGTTGGSIALTASKAVNLTPTARINASGPAGGGTIAIGTSLKRTAIAQTTSIAAGARVSANATQNGNGGHVTVLSTQQTTMAGTISATGGKQGGNGGLIEVSGQGGFALTGATDVTAPMGNAGTILLDPANLIVTNGTNGSGSLDGSLAANGAITTGNAVNAGGTDTVSNAEIDSLNGAVVLQAGTALSIASNTPITLKNNASLTLQTSAGPITLGTNSPITASGTGAVVLTAGSIGSGASITLGSNITTSGSGEIVLQADGNIILQSAALTTGLLGLTSNNGALSQSTAGILNAGSLFSRFGVAGSVSLPGTANAITRLGGFSVAGSLVLVNATPLTITSIVGGGPVTSVTAPSITLGNGLAAAGVLKASTGGQVSIQTGTLTVAQTNAGTLSAPSGTVSIAPYHSTDTLLLGGASSTGTLGINPGAIVFNTSVLNLGGSGGVPASGNIVIVGDGNLSAIATRVDLLTSGAVTQAGGTLQVATLGGTASSVALTQTGNSIGTLAGFSAINGFTLTNTGSLAIAGAIDSHNGAFVINNGTAPVTLTGGVTAATAELTGGSIDISGSLGVATLASLVANPGSIGVTGLLNAGTVNASAATGISIVNTGSIGTVGSIIAGTSIVLSQTGGLTVTGPVTASTQADIIAGSLTVSGGIAAPAITLAASTGSLLVSGSVTPSASATLTAAGLLSVTGTVAPPAGTITLGLTAGTLSIPGLVSDGGAGTTTLNAGTIVENAGTLIAGTLTGTASEAVLTGSRNAIATLGSFTASQSFQLFDSNALEVIGAVGGGSVVALSAPAITLGDTASAAPGTLTVGNAGRISIQTNNLLSGTTAGTLTAPAGTLEIAPFQSSGTAALGAASSAGTLGFISGNFSLTGSVLNLGGNDGTVASGGIVIGAGLGPFGTLDLLTLGTVTQTAPLTATLVTGSAAAVTLVTAGNSIGTLGHFSVTNDFSLTNAASLSVTGPVISGATVALNTGTFGLGVPGSIGASSVTLTAGPIAIGGTLAATNTAALFATTGAISESPAGAIHAGTLTGRSALGVTLNGANAIAILGSFSVNNDFSLANAASLSVAGPLSAGGTVALNTGTFGLGVPGNVSASAATLNAGSIALGGTLAVSGIASLLTTTGAITEATGGIIQAATLTGSTASGASFLGANTIATLGSFSAGGDLSLTNAASLSVAGPLSSSGTVTLSTGSLGLSVPGTITAGAATLSAGAITIGGTLAITNNATLTASNGDISEAGGVINAGTLSGGASGNASLTGVNTIGTLANISTMGTLAVLDTGLLLTAGTVSAGTLVTVTAPTLTIGGTIGAPSVTLAATTGTLALNGTVDTPNASLSGMAGISGAGVVRGNGALSAISTDGAVALSGNNAIAALDGSASTGFAVLNTTPLTAGTVIAGSTASIAAPSLTVGGTVAAASVTLAASAGSLSVTGLVAPSASATLTATGLLSVAAGGTVAPTSGSVSLDLNGGTIALAGLVSAGGAGTASLAAQTITQTGTLIAGTLTGSAAVASLTGQVGTLGNFSAGTLTLNDTAPLTVAGSVTIGSSVSIAGTGSLLVSGTIAPLSGPIQVGLTSDAGAPLTISGAVSDGGGTTSLYALNSGTIGVTGSLAAGTLTGSAGVASLTGSITIADLAGFTADSTLLIAGQAPLLVSGPVAAGALASIGAGTLTLGAGVTAPSTTLTATSGALTLDGPVNASSVAALSGFAGVNGTGIVTAGALTASSAGGSVALTNANTVASVSGSAAAGFSLANAASLTTGTVTAGTIASITAPSLLAAGTISAPSVTLAATAGTLTVTGAVEATTKATLTATGLLTNQGTIAANTATAIQLGLSASALALGGVVSDGGHGTTSLVASNGTIAQTGTLIAGTLTGQARNSGGTLFDATLTGSNQITTLGSFSAANFRLDNGTGLTVNGPVPTNAATLNAAGSLAVNGAIGANAGDTTLIAGGGITVAGQALIWSLNGTVDLRAGGLFSQTGGLINGQEVVINASAIAQSGGIIASADAVNLNAGRGAFSETGGIVTANGTTTILGGGGFTINAGTIITGSTLRLGTGGTLAMTGGELAAGSDITIGGTTPGSATGGSVSQTGGTIASAGTLYANAGGNLLMTATGTRYAATLNVDSTGTTDVNLNGGAVTVTLGGTLVDSGGLPPPGPVASAQNFAPGNLGRQTMTISGGAILIDQTEVAGALALFAHGGTIAGNINETATGGINVGPLEGYARNGGSVALNQGTNFIGTLLAFSNGLTAAFASDGDVRLTDQESLGIPGALLIGLANTGSVNTGNLSANGYIVVGGSIGGGSGTSVANITLSTGTGSTSGGILIGGAITANGTQGNGGTVTLASALNIAEAGGTLTAYQLNGGTGNGGGGNASADLTGAGNLIQALGSFTTNNGGLALVNGRDLSVTGPVTATAADLAITVHAGGLTVTGTGSLIATNGTAAGLPTNGNIALATDGDITVHGLIAGGTASTVALTADAPGAGGGTITADSTGGDAGLISVRSLVPTAGGLVRPGTIRLRTDALALTSNGTAVSAPDGLVDIAPNTGASVISLDSIAGHNPGTLSLAAATLAAINTKGNLATGLPGVGELLLGSLDGSTSRVSAINITAPISLPGVQTLALFSNGPISETNTGALSVNALAGYGTALQLNGGGNAIAHLGVPRQNTSNGQIYQTDTAFLTGNPASLSNLTASTGSIRLHDTTGTLAVTGTLVAASGQTIDLAAPTLLIDATTSGASFNAGSLSVAAGQILLAADALRIESTGTAPIVSALEGLVAITPYTASHTISIDATAQSTATDLSLATGDLALIRTMTASDTAPAALGSQTLMIGSQNVGATLPNAGITINAPLNLGGTVANTLGLYGTGSITGTSAITVDALTSRAGVLLNGTVAGSVPADILLTGENTIGTLGAVTASGNITIINAGNLTQQTGATVQAGDDPTLAAHGGVNHATATISVLTGSLTIGGTIQGGSDSVLKGNVVLNDGGTVVIAATGSLFAANAGSVGITAAGDIDIDGAIWGERTTAKLAGTVNLTAGGSINEPFTPGLSSAAIGASLLTGSAGGQALLFGDGTPTLNQIANLGSFTTNAGLQLRDGQALTVTGPVSDQGTSSQGISLVVAPSATPFPGSADLIISGTIAAQTAVTLQATGNVFEATGGVISAPTLAAQAGMLPTTEGGQAPGTYTAGNVTSTAAVSLAGPNRITTLSGITATGNALINNASDLTVTGTVLAGVGGATGNPTAPPTAEVDVASGNLTIATTGVVHAGLDSTTTGNVTLRAGSNATAGSVTVDGGAYAANGGTVTISAGYNATTGTYNSVASGSGITLNGTLAGDLNGAVPPGLVTLLAAASIDEPAAAASLQASTLTGQAGGHANLSETNGGALATIASANRIANLGSLTVNAGTADPAGLSFRDGQALTVSGPVTDTSAGVSIAVVPGSGAAYTRADLAISGAITAGTTVNLQATGNVFETPGGSVTAPVLTSQSGVIPSTEATASAPLGIGIAFFGNVNQVGTLGNITATGDFLLSNGQNLVVGGTVLAGTLGSASGTPGAAPGPWGTTPSAEGTPFAEIDVPGNLTIAPGAIVRAGADGARTGNVTLRAGSDTTAGSVSVLGNVYAANGGTVTISAGFNPNSGAYNSAASGSGILVQGTIAGDRPGPGLAGLVNLDAAASIDEPVAAAQIATSLLTGHAGAHVNLSQTAPGGLGSTGSANQIATLGSFAANTGTDDPQGFRLRDGQSLTITGPVTDAGSTASLGISIAVVPDPPGIYSSGDLLIAGPVSAATAIDLQATGNVIEQTGGAIAARTLTTQAGVIPTTEVRANAAGTYPAVIITPNASDFLGNAANPFANQIGTLANATATGTLSLYDSHALTVSGTLLGGVTQEASQVSGGTLIGTGISLATPGLLTVTGTLTVASQSGVLALTGGTIDLTGSPVLRADTMEIASAGSLQIGSGTTLYTGGDVFGRPGPDLPPTDPGADTPGAHFYAGTGGVQQTGVLDVLPYVAITTDGAVATAHPELQISLTGGSGTVSFDPTAGLVAPTTSLLLDLGAGNATGHVIAFDLAAFYTSLSGTPTVLGGTLFTPDGVPVTDQSAAADAFIAEDGLYVPTTHFQINGCAFTSVSCILIAPLGAAVPQGSPLRDLPSAFFEDQSDDPDLMIPNVTDRVN